MLYLFLEALTFEIKHLTKIKYNHNREIFLLFSPWRKLQHIRLAYIEISIKCTGAVQRELFTMLYVCITGTSIDQSQLITSVWAARSSYPDVTEGIILWFSSAWPRWSTGEAMFLSCRHWQILRCLKILQLSRVFFFRVVQIFDVPQSYWRIISTTLFFSPVYQWFPSLTLA